jgi:Tfp pilus assembly protein PilO
MKKNLIVSIILLILLVGFWSFYKQMLIKQPSTIDNLQTEISEKKRQLLSAQIISRNLQNVNELIQNNMVNSPDDSLAKPANMAFLQYLTELMDNNDIVLLSIKPLDVIKQDEQKVDQWGSSFDKPQIDTTKEFISTPYSMSVLASYVQLGHFFQELEKSPRLIKIVRFQLENPMDLTVVADDVSGKSDQRRVNIDLHTLTIVKASYKSGQNQFN